MPAQERRPSSADRRIIDCWIFFRTPLKAPAVGSHSCHTVLAPDTSNCLVENINHVNVHFLLE